MKQHNGGKRSMYGIDRVCVGGGAIYSRSVGDVSCISKYSVLKKERKGIHLECAFFQISVLYTCSYYLPTRNGK